jgi:hypothetical protein
MKTKIPCLALLCLTLAAPIATGAGDDRGEGPRPFRMPPQEAQAACAKLALGAACSFTFDGRAHTGVCRRGPEGEGPIACAPHRGGPGQAPGGGPGEPGKGSPQPKP